MHTNTIEMSSLLKHFVLFGFQVNLSSTMTRNLMSEMKAVGVSISHKQNKFSIERYCVGSHNDVSPTCNKQSPLGVNKLTHFMNQVMRWALSACRRRPNMVIGFVGFCDQTKNAMTRLANHRGIGRKAKLIAKTRRREMNNTDRIKKICKAKLQLHHPKVVIIN